MPRKVTASDGPRKPTFAEKQLEEQNRQLRQQMDELQTKLELALAPVNPNDAKPPAPMSKEWEHNMQEREFGRLEGERNMLTQVVNDLLHLIGKAIGVESE